jgi:probable F420-dependent oxidoreductase
VQVGAIFPQSELGADAGEITAFAQGVQALGYDHLLVYDHVVGADGTHHEGAAYRPAHERPANPSDRRAVGLLPYSLDDMFHEPFVLFGFLAAVAPGLELAPSVIIAPQRQTLLMAKQAAEVAVLTGGRFRLGIGIGWNAVEFEALGMSFGDRARRFEEQIDLMRRLWREHSIDFAGTWHTVSAAGLNPHPPGNDIPIWAGAGAEVALRRAARLCDGLFVGTAVLEDPEATVDHVRELVVAEGRDPDTFGFQGRMAVTADSGADDWARSAERWAACGVSHLAVNSQFDGLRGADEHLERLQQVAEALGVRR